MNTEHFLKEENKKKLENTIKQMELELDEINKVRAPMRFGN